MAKREAEYFRNNVKKNRQIDKILGPRYNSPEANPGETYLQFKRRHKNMKLLTTVSLGAVFFFQFIPIVM